MDWHKVSWSNVKNYWIGALIGALSTIFLLFVLFFFTYPLDFHSFLYSPIYRTYSYLGSNDAFVTNVTEFCEPFKGIDLVDCVIAQVKPYMNYEENRTNGIFTEGRGVKSPSEIVRDGELVCRDGVTLYAAIFKKMGYQVIFRFIPHHVYLTVYFEDEAGNYIYCELDYAHKMCY